MKKIVILIVALSAMVMGKDVYVGIAGSMSSADQYGIDCRASGVLLAGVNVYESEAFSTDIEGRVHIGMGGGYNVKSLYIKPEYNNLYALIGIGSSNIGEDTLTGVHVGAGYQLPKNIFIDVVYREPEESFVTTLGIRYRF